MTRNELCMKSSMSEQFVMKTPLANLALLTFSIWMLKESRWSYRHRTILKPTFFSSVKFSHDPVKIIGTWLEDEFAARQREEPMTETIKWVQPKFLGGPNLYSLLSPLGLYVLWKNI